MSTPTPPIAVYPYDEGTQHLAQVITAGTHFVIQGLEGADAGVFISALRDEGARQIELWCMLGDPAAEHVICRASEQATITGLLDEIQHPEPSTGEVHAPVITVLKSELKPSRVAAAAGAIGCGISQVSHGADQSSCLLRSTHQPGAVNLSNLWIDAVDHFDPTGAAQLRRMSRPKNP